MKKYYNVIFIADLGTREEEFVCKTFSDKTAAEQYIGSADFELDFLEIEEWIFYNLTTQFDMVGASIEEVSLTNDEIEAAIYEEDDDAAVACRLGISGEFANWLAKQFLQGRF